MLVTVQDPRATNTACNPLAEYHAGGQSGGGGESKTKVGHADDELIVQHRAHATV